MKSSSDVRPHVFEAVGNGSYLYRWGIQQVEEAAPAAPSSEGDSEGAPSEGAQPARSWWEYSEVVVWAPVSREKLTAAVLAATWDSDYEAKLVNDYNAAKEGIFGAKTGEEAKKYAERYTAFLSARKALKEQVAADCAALSIA